MSVKQKLLVCGDIDWQCAVKCEVAALQHFDFDVNEDEVYAAYKLLGEDSVECVPLFNVGSVVGSRGLSVTRRYECSTIDIRDAVSVGDFVLVVIDAIELLGGDTKEPSEPRGAEDRCDMMIIHAITDDCIAMVNPLAVSTPVVCPLSRFRDAWKGWSNYMIVISRGDVYIPHPVNIDDIEVEDELLELREAIAENAHEVWAANRLKEGWSYGPVRDDEKKQSPDMRPYNLLPESEKEYDRQMAMHTIKLIKRLGWNLTRHETTVKKRVRAIKEKALFSELELCAVAALALRILCADRRIVNSELVARNRLFSEYGITYYHEQNALTLGQAHQVFLNMSKEKQRAVENILNVLAHADGVLHPEEEKFISDLIKESAVTSEMLSSAREI